MMTAKTYIRLFITFILVFLVYHALVWQFKTKPYVAGIEPGAVGNLARLGYIDNPVTIDIKRPILAKQHLPFDPNQKIDVLTIGDSFSNGIDGQYYQDVIASKQGLTVMNMLPYYRDYMIETVLILLENGILDRLQPKAIILESAENLAVKRFARPVNWDMTLDEATLMKKLSFEWSGKAPTYDFINNLNYNSMLYTLLFYVDDNAFFSKVHKHTLSRPLFSSKHPDWLLFLKRDLDHLNEATPEAIAHMNDHLNKLQHLLDEKGIALYFMPAVDKYTLYAPYILDNPYPESRFFDLLRDTDKTYTLIDTHARLSPRLAQGELDLYYSDDSHWRVKATEIIFEAINF